MTVSSGNEVQSVTVSGASSGTFTLTYAGQTTSGVAFDAAASAVQTALRALSNIGSGNVTVGGANGGPFTVTFTGTLRDTNVAQMTASAAGLDAGTVVVATVTQGDQAVTEEAYTDTSVANSTISNTEFRVGDVPPAGSLLVDKSDYYGTGGP